MTIPNPKTNLHSSESLSTKKFDLVQQHNEAVAEYERCHYAKYMHYMIHPLTNLLLHKQIPLM